jgi:hypothetical protein
MPAAVERIVVQTTARDKRAIAAKAKRLSLTISELMRRGAFAYQVADSDELVAIAGAAKEAADRARAAIDDALEFIAASNKRIESMEARHTKRASRRTA